VLGHPGFTGTELSVAPEAGVAWALLTNQLHPTSAPVDIAGLRTGAARLILTGTR
jgi:CubicO group peptidase (beta-lactamase class C family)